MLKIRRLLILLKRKKWQKYGIRPSDAHVGVHVDCNESPRNFKDIGIRKTCEG